MVTVLQLMAWRDSLLEARFSGIRSVRDQNGETIEYRSDAELARALAAAEAAIAAAGRRPASTIRFATSKGL